MFRDAFEEEYNPKGERMPTGGEGMTPLPKYKEVPLQFVILEV